MQAKTLPASYAPKFVRGTVVVREGKTIGEYPKVLVSATGVFGLKWPPFVPAHHFGKLVTVKVQLQVGHSISSFETSASVAREITMRAERMGLRFLFPNKEALARVSAFINQHGHLPGEYTRKYPRIPSSQFMEEFKLKAAGTALETPLNPTPKKIVYRINNLSPDGLMISTGSENARFVRPGDLIDLRLQGETKGSAASEIGVKCRVYRCLQEVNPLTHEENWSFGVQFFRMEERQKQAYFKVLEKILQTIKSSAA